MNVKKIIYISSYIISLLLFILGTIMIVRAYNYKTEATANPITWFENNNFMLTDVIVGMSTFIMATLFLLFAIMQHLKDLDLKKEGL